jgi:hypothetical protein
VKDYLFVASHDGITFYLKQMDEKARGMNGALAFPVIVDYSLPGQRYQNLIKNFLFISRCLSEVSMGME